MSDALKDVVIHVTPQLIIEGKRNNCYCCPVALAIKEAVGPDTKLEVQHNFTGYWLDPDFKDYTRVENPRRVREFIRWFDSDQGPAHPFTDTVRIPERFLPKPKGVSHE